MHPTRRALLGLACLPWLHACGGGDYWDEYRPRAATPSDLEDRSFVFTDFRYGAVFHASWSATTATLAFGSAGAPVSPASFAFTLATVAGSSAGTATLADDALTLVIAEPAPGHPFVPGETLAFTVTADVDDGRIRLVNRASGEEQTSAP